jgi:hypothetical protein
MKVFNEEQLLDDNFRKQVIEEIESPENESRKQESFKRYEIYRDRIKKYILLQLQNELDPETVLEMQQRVATINIFKKIVKKKARVYQTRPERSVNDSEEATEDLQNFIDSIKLNLTMKKANRFMEAMQNVGIEVMPYEIPNEFVDGNPVYSLKLNVLAPHFYDVIEDAKNPEIVRCYIKSHYHSDAFVTDQYPYERTATTLSSNFRDGDNRQQAIADSPADQGDENKKYYTWWSDTYHFTTDNKGRVLDREYKPVDMLTDENAELWENPIGVMPAVFDGKDQDYSFWSVGGEDIIEGSILINTLLTDNYFAAKMQSTGLFYLFGKGIPKTVKTGANKAITVEVEEGEPTPQIGFANPSPNLDMVAKLIEQNLAMLLSTNDLEPDTVRGSLNTANAASGVQEMIQRSEPTNAIEDEHERYRELEPKVVRIAGMWAGLYKETRQLSPVHDVDTDMAEVDYSVTYPKPVPYMTDSEKLDNIDKKLRLNLTSKVQAYMEANAGTTKEDAEAAIAQIALENLENLKRNMEAGFGQGDKEDNSEETQDDDSEEMERDS